MSDLTPRIPRRPLIWMDFVLALRDALLPETMPVYLVGGAVRDALLHRPIKDLDLATPGDSIRLARRIANHWHGDIFVLDDARGVARVLLDVPETGALTLDIARFRGASLADDLADRDFTLNAMAVDLRGDLELLIDPLNGEQDAINRILRRCSPHALADDPLRALRAVRQSTQLQLRIVSETAQDVRAAADGLRQVSPERLRDELVALLSLTRAAVALRVAAVMELLNPVLPEVKTLQATPLSLPHARTCWEYALAVVEQLKRIVAVISPGRHEGTAATFDMGMLVIQLDRFRSRLQTELGSIWANNRTEVFLLALAVLLHDVDQPADSPSAAAGERAAARADALRLSNDEKRRLITLTQYSRLLLSLPDNAPLTLHRFWRQVGEAGIGVCLLGLAHYLGNAGALLMQDDWLRLVERVRMLLLAYYEQYEQIVAPPPLLRGDQLSKRLQLKPGPAIKRLLRELAEAQVQGQVTTAAQALAYARALLPLDDSDSQPSS